MAAEGVLDEEPLVGPDSRTGGRNFMPLPYRRVSYQPADFPLTDAGLRTIVGRDAYRRTEFVVFHDREGVAVAAVETADRQPLFSPITRAAWLSPPARTRFVVDRAVDVGVPSLMAARAVEIGLAADETLVVLGRYEHVNFIARPGPVAITVVEVAPPEPPKLWDLVERVLAMAPLAAALPEARADRPAEALPRRRRRGRAATCSPAGPRGSRRSVRRCTSSTSDRSGPTGCSSAASGAARSTSICTVTAHRRWRCARASSPAGATEPTIVKCCLLEEGLERDGQVVVVPWGAGHDEVETGLRELVGPA